MTRTTLCSVFTSVLLAACSENSKTIDASLAADAAVVDAHAVANDARRDAAASDASSPIDAHPIDATSIDAFTCSDGGAQCFNFSTDPNHCGSCDNQCPNETNAQPTCDNGVSCGITCEAGFADCDMDASNGCEINIESDSNHCNACSNACPFGPHSTAVCTIGDCGLVCDPGFGDCDQVPNDGCEVNENVDHTNCGGCNHPCGDTQLCVGGTCM